VLTAIDNAEGTGTQVDSQTEFDQDDLGETVVFKSAFVRSHQNLSGTSLASAPCISPGQLDDGATGLPFLRSVLELPAEPQDDFFTRLSLPALTHPSAPEPRLPADLRPGLGGLGGLWGLSAVGVADSWALGQDFPPSTGSFAAPPLNPPPALNFDIFSYLDVDGAAGATGNEPSRLGGLYQTNTAESAGSGVWLDWNGRSSAAVDSPSRQVALPGPPGLSAAVSAHGSSGSLGGQAPLSSSFSARSRTALPPPGLG
jgi:hypothetical protein